MFFSGNFYRTVGYAGCLQEASNIKMLMNWVRRMEKMEWKRKETVGEYKGVKNAVCKFMQHMMDEEVLSFEYDDQSDQLIFDIAYRMALLNPNMFDRIRETPGVVLIDELDMHLHPKWQWRVVEALKETFPNVQFIAATHSPIVIASCKDVKLIIIDEHKQIRYNMSPYGMDVNDTLDICQNSQTLPKDIKSIIDEFTDEIDETELEEAEKKLSKLKEILGEDHPKVIWAEETLDLEKMPLGD